MKISGAHLLIFFTCYALISDGFATDVLTFHNNNAHTGLNAEEVTLTPQNVNASSFGLLRNLPVDGAVYAQTLYVSNAQVISGGQSQGFHNLLIVATEHDSVYAFDADSGALYWQISLLAAGEVPSDPLNCPEDLPVEVGVTSTPVIDRAMGPHGTIYVLAMSKTAGTANYYERLHALDLATGLNVLTPMLIQASYPGDGPANIFNAAQERGRAGLLLTNGTIYTAWASFCDFPPYSGWILAYDERTLAQTAVFNADPNGTPASSDLPDGSGSGIWQAGSPLGVDAAGNLYAATGNGPFDTNLSNGFPATKDYGDTFLKLTSGLQVTDYFTPDTQLTLAEADGDFNSGGHLILDIADSSRVIHHLLVTAGKDTNIYVLDRDNLGKYNSGTNNIYQEVDGVLPEGVWSSPAYFNGSIYYEPFMNSLLQFQFTGNAMLDPVPTSGTSTQFAAYGDSPSISSNGNTNGIVWIQESLPSQVVLHAYDATNLANQLYSSAGVNIGAPTKFGPPTVCNGKVFVGTMNSVGVFGLLHPPSGPGSDQVASSFVSYSGDFNGDGKQDILWRNTETGEVDIWFMNGASVTAKAKVGTIGSEWKISGIADFNGDGKSDILWQNTLNGTFGIWIMNGASYVGQGFNSQGPQWSIVGVGDIDHTGFADILWRNIVTGELVAWKSGSGLIFNSFYIGTATLDWNVVGIANLFDSSESALIWRNQNSGEVVAWQLSGNAISGQSSLGVVPLNWTVAGFGDFNGDGHQDILWHNSSDGTVVAWMMNGFQVSAQWINQNFISQDWQIRATPNVVGSGPNSILWSDSQTGEQVIWILAGSGISQTSVGFAPPPWTVLR